MTAKEYIGSLGLLRVGVTLRRPLAVRSRGLACRCLGDVTGAKQINSVKLTVISNMKYLRYILVFSIIFLSNRGVAIHDSQDKANYVFAASKYLDH